MGVSGTPPKWWDPLKLPIIVPDFPLPIQNPWRYGKGMGIGWGPAYHKGVQNFWGVPWNHPLRSSEFWDPFFWIPWFRRCQKQKPWSQNGIRFEGRGQICWWCLVAGFRQAGDQSGHGVFQVVKWRVWWNRAILSDRKCLLCCSKNDQNDWMKTHKNHQEEIHLWVMV